MKELILLLKSDSSRYGIEKISLINLIKIFFIHPTPGLKFMMIFRTMQYYKTKNKFIFAIFFLYYRKLKVKYGFDISFRTKIGKGFYIGHFGGIVIHGDCIIGENCNISQGVTIGVINHGEKKGTPIIGNKVFIGPNSCILGKIIIGNNVTIGANSVVSKNVTNNQTVISISSVIIDKDLSSHYIHNIN